MSLAATSLAGCDAVSAGASAEEDEGSEDGLSLWLDSTAELVGAGGDHHGILAPDGWGRNRWIATKRGTRSTQSLVNFPILSRTGR